MSTADRVKETTTSTSTSIITLAGAVAGSIPFSSAALTTGIPVLVGPDSANAWLIGLYTYTDATTLTRESILSSSAGGSSVTLAAGTKNVTCTLPASVINKFVSTDATAATTVANSATSTVVMIESGVAKQISLDNLVAELGTASSALPAASALSGSDILIISQGGIEKQTTLSALATFIGVPDTTAPSFASAQVTSATPTEVVITYNEILAAFTPATSAYAVSGGKTVTGIARSGATITLTVNAAYSIGDTITVTYTKPGTNQLRDASGNETASHGPSSVTNNIADTTSPTFSSAQVTNATKTEVVLTFSETLAAFTPATSAFAVSGGKTVTGIARSGATITLTVSAPYAYGDTITVTYTKPGSNQLRDAAGNETASFGPSSVTNNALAAPGAPTIGTATAGDTTAGVPFTAPASNGGATITTYTATSSPGGITGTLSQAGSGTISVTGLTNGTAYTFTVTATNSQGTGSPSSASNSVTPAAAGAAYLFSPTAFDFPGESGGNNMAVNGYAGTNPIIWIKSASNTVPANVKMAWSKSSTVAPAVYSDTSVSGHGNGLQACVHTGSWTDGGGSGQTYWGLFGPGSTLFAWGTPGTWYLWIITDDGFSAPYDNHTGTPVGYTF